MTAKQNRTGKFSYKQYSLYAGSVLIVAAMLMCGGELYFGTIEGDLTSLGSLPEKDFGWQQTQPLVATNYLHSYPIADADVLIIGDSFSATLVWLRIPVQTGHAFHGKLDSHSRANWTLIPRQTGQ